MTSSGGSDASALASLTARVAARRRDLDRKSGQVETLTERREQLIEEVERLEQESDLLDRVATLLNTLGDQRQAQAQGTIEALVTQGLHLIFDPTLSFHIVTTTKTKTTTVEFVVRTTVGTEVVQTPVLDARGGGLSATVGFLLRVVVLLLDSSARGERVLVLDETFAMVSKEYLPAVAEFLRQIVDRSGIQIIMVTHQEELMEGADAVYRFWQVDGRTKVDQVTSGVA